MPLGKYQGRPLREIPAGVIEKALAHHSTVKMLQFQVAGRAYLDSLGQ